MTNKQVNMLKSIGKYTHLVWPLKQVTWCKVSVRPLNLKRHVLSFNSEVASNDDYCSSLSLLMMFSNLWIHNGVFGNRYKGNTIYLLETFPALTTSKMLWMDSTLTSSRSWNQRWYRQLMTCLAMRFQTFWRTLEIPMTKCLRSYSNWYNI